MPVKTLARSAFRTLQKVAGKGSRRLGWHLIAPDASDAVVDDLRRRAVFYFGADQGARVTVHRTLTPGVFLDGGPIMTFGVSTADRLLTRLHTGLFDIDWRTNPTEGWNWIYAANWAADHQPDVAAAERRLTGAICRVRAGAAGPACVFGTGPSLGHAGERDWSSFIRIVCNTIVRDADLWRHIDPQFIVAGDGIYHFGFTDFAAAFRSDLRSRLEESPATLFVYPAPFDLVMRRELGHLEEQLVPVPNGFHRSFHAAFNGRFELPNFDNALTLLLLPLACSLSRDVKLWGFDGRAPADRLFWSNSAKQSYPELMHHLKAAHPAFFEANVPASNPDKYFRSAMGDKLEAALAESEAAGWSFEILHESWTEALRRRSAWKDVPA